MRNSILFTLRSLRVLFFAVIPLILTAQVPDITVTGIVLNGTTGEPLPGANVVAVGTGTVTDARGQFSLLLPPGSIVEISHIGFAPVTVSAVGEPIIARLMPAVLRGEEVVVTAGLTEELLQSVTSSVAVVGRAQLVKLDENHLQGVVESIPNVHYAGGTSRPRYFQIRGMGERSHYAGEGPPNFSVGFVMDDVDLSGLGMAALAYDLDQVEVYRGPQSAVFGPNALAGLIALRSTDPGNEFTVTARSGLGIHEINRRGAAVGGPLGKNLAYRLSYHSGYGNGFRENIARSSFTTNERDERMMRAKLRFTPSPRLYFLGTFFRTVLDNGYDAWAPDNNILLNTYSDDKGEDSQSTDAASLRTKMLLTEQITLTSITAYSETVLTHSYDGDWGNDEFWAADPYDFIAFREGWQYKFFDSNDRHRATVTQEFRVASGGWVAGVYGKAMNEKDDATGYLYGGDATEMTSDYDFSVTAGYGQLQLPVGDRMMVKGNIRVETNAIRYNGTAAGYDIRGQFVTLDPLNYNTDHTLVGGKGSVHYKLNPNATVFGVVARGYKTGGVNQHPYLAESNRLYDPEYILNAEVGYRLAGDQLTFSSVLFAAKRTDQQVSISSQQKEGDPNSFFYYTANATTGALLGSELDGKFQLGEGYSLSASLGLLSTYIDPFTFEESGGNITLGGRGAAHAPGYSYSLAFDTGRPFGLFTHLEIIGKDEFYYSDSHNQLSSAYQLVNAHVGFRRGPWSVKMWGRNILDERYAVRGFYFGLEPPDYEDKLYVSWGDPRHFGLMIEFNF